MKKYTKLITGVSIASVLSISLISAMDADPVLVKDLGEKVIPISIEEQALTPFYSQFTGTVKDIVERESFPTSKLVLLENEDGIEANLVITDKTYFVNDKEIKIGSKVTGFYETDAPMIMIYPAQYNTRVVAVDYEGPNLAVDRFDEKLTSRNGALILNIGDNTVITTEAGKVFEGSLENKQLVVEYGISILSYPAKITPDRVVVLDGKDQGVAEEAPLELIDLTDAPIVVADKILKGTHGYMNEAGEIMVPLRAIAEALGYEVQWEAENQRVFLGVQMSLEIGKDSYNYMRMAPIQLGAAPELVDGKTYVPLRFFKEVARMNNAYFFEGQIVIDNNEVME